MGTLETLTSRCVTTRMANSSICEDFLPGTKSKSSSKETSLFAYDHTLNSTSEAEMQEYKPAVTCLGQGWPDYQHKQDCNHATTCPTETVCGNSHCNHSKDFGVFDKFNYLERILSMVVHINEVNLCIAKVNATFGSLAKASGRGASSSYPPNCLHT